MRSGVVLEGEYAKSFHGVGKGGIGKRSGAGQDRAGGEADVWMGKGDLKRGRGSVRLKRVLLRLGRHETRPHGRCRERGGNCDRAGSLSGCGRSQAEKDLYVPRES